MVLIIQTGLKLMETYKRLNTSLTFNPLKYHDFFVMGEFNVGKVDDIFFL